MNIKNIITFILLAHLSIIGYAACNACSDTGGIITNNGNNSYTAVTAQGYFWEVCEGDAIISGANNAQNVTVINNSGSSYNIKVSIFRNGECEEACETVTIIQGCTDDTACNFNPAATVDDGNCDFSAVDCEGICGGNATEDCNGVCEGPAVEGYMTGLVITTLPQQWMTLVVTLEILNVQIVVMKYWVAWTVVLAILTQTLV